MRRAHGFDDEGEDPRAVPKPQEAKRQRSFEETSALIGMVKDLGNPRRSS